MNSKVATIKPRDPALDVSRSSRASSSFMSMRHRRQRSVDEYSSKDHFAEGLSFVKDSFSRLAIPGCIRDKMIPELGSGINYVNLCGRHGEIATALEAAREARKPLLAYFVSWPGSPETLNVAQGIFSHPDLVHVINTAFVPAAFNLRDRNNKNYNMAHTCWAGDMSSVRSSSPGFLRIISPDGITVLGGTRPLHNNDEDIAHVRMTLMLALSLEGDAIPLALTNQLSKTGRQSRSSGGSHTSSVSDQDEQGALVVGSALYRGRWG
jgi:hypothetical protein